VILSITSAILIFLAAIIGKIPLKYRGKFFRRGAEFLLLSTVAAFFSLCTEGDIRGFSQILNDQPWILTGLIPTLVIVLLVADILRTLVELSGFLGKRKPRRKTKKKAKGGI